MVLYFSILLFGDGMTKINIELDSRRYKFLRESNVYFSQTGPILTILSFQSF